MTVLFFPGISSPQLASLERMLTTGQLRAAPTPLFPADILGRVRRVVAALRSTRTFDGRRRLSRLHVRAPTLQAVFIREDHKPAWRRTGEAAAKAVLSSARRRCTRFKTFRPDDVTAVTLEREFAVANEERAPIVRFNASDPVPCWREGPGLFCLAPSLACWELKEEDGEEASASALVAQLG